jgi:CelD/BcsL family acetyltransferase involved in cellulose biosynthesis
MSYLPPDLRTVTVRSIDALVPHFNAWDELACAAPQKLPTLLPGWVDAYLRHNLKPKESWLCIFAYSGSRLVGVLPVIVTPHWLFGSYRPVVRTLSDTHTPTGDVLLACDHAGPAFKALLSELSRQVPRHLALDLRAVRANSPVWGAINDLPAGWAMHRGSRSQYSFLDVGGDDSTYWSSLRNMRRNLRRYRKKLEGRGHVSVEIKSGADATEDLLAKYLALEASGWKGRNGTAILSDPRAVAFYTTLFRNFAAQRRWEWHLIRVGDRIIAEGMGVRCGASLILPKIAFDEDFADCMPGSLLTGEVIKHAFSCLKLEEINHLSSAEWHELWRMGRHEYTDIHLIPHSVLPLMFRLPRIVIQSVYDRYVRPSIPMTLREFRRRFKRRGDRRPRRAAENHTTCSGATG